MKRNIKKKKISIKDLSKELKECQKIKKEYLAGWQRTQADFLNYKNKETDRNKGLAEYITENLILKILPIFDSFDRAEREITEEIKNKEIIQGFFQIKKQFQDFLKSQGVEEIKAKGKIFDPNFHEAIELVEAKGKESGIVAKQVQKGYKLYGRVIRPAKVKVTK